MLTKFFFSVYLILLIAIDPGDIATVNKYKKTAQEAYENNDYAAAAEAYQFLVDSMGVMESEVFLNMAHCYFKTDDETKALHYYQSLTNDKDPMVRSVAYQQLGVINASKKDYKKALEDFKDALKANPKNEDARYDYEVVKRKLQEEEEKKKEEEKENEKKEDQKEKQDQQKQDQQQDKQDEQSDQDQDQESEQKKDDENKEKEQQDEQEKQKEQQEQQQSEEEKQKQQEQQQQIENPEINRARAEQILKSMEEQEKQYFQQLKKKSKKKTETGPDW